MASGKIKCPNPDCRSGLIWDKNGFNVTCHICDGTSEVDAPKPKEMEKPPEGSGDFEGGD